MTEDPTSSGKPSIIVEVERLFIAAGLTEEEAREAIFLIIETGADHAQSPYPVKAGLVRSFLICSRDGSILRLS
jgi:hypothetical protein